MYVRNIRTPLSPYTVKMRFQKLSNTLPIALMCARAVAAFDNTRFDNVSCEFDRPHKHVLILCTVGRVGPFLCQYNYPLIILIRYWGQNSYGAGHSNDPANFQKRLSFYCGDDSTIDVFPVAFLHVFFGQGGLPSINLANVSETDSKKRRKLTRCALMKDMQHLR